MDQDPRSSGFPDGHPDMQSLLGVPVMMGDQLYGMLYLTDRLDGQLFSEQDQYVIEVMASYAALAIANSQLQEQRSRLTVLEERERIMMELHDGVIQSIYAIGMQVDLLANTTQDAAQLEGLRRVIGGLNTVIEDIRQYIQNLRTMDGDDQQSFADCVEDVLNRIHVPSKLNVEIKAPQGLRPPISSTALEAVCQIVHEALSNVVRHANATQVEVDAAISDDVFTVTVDDNGSGFEVSERDTHGLGLRNIQQRARMHGGQIEIDSTPGAGTRLTIKVPIKPF
jgi:signal transduction histidine kinase